MKKFKRFFCVAAAGALILSVIPLSACSKNDDALVLRVANWEEYIDLGGWDDDELIDIENDYGDGGVIGKNALYDDFVEWFNAGGYGFKVRVEYSTFGTNEDLYNRMNLGDKFDLVCPSDYMIMKLLAEDKLEKFSEGFFDTAEQNNYYINNVSPYIEKTFKDNGWQDYAAGYMWGTTGMIYNPELVSTNDVKSYDILKNPQYARKITIKDNVRDSYFPTLAIMNKEELLSDGIEAERRSDILNATDAQTVDKAEQMLKTIKNNVYSFETDSGKADMITGKVAANYQWSGDGVYIIDEAESDKNNPTELWYSVPDECTNLWFDGWVMLKDGIGGDANRKIAAEAFVNFLSRPDNAIRNMYFIGYTSAIAGDMVFEYTDYNFGAVFDSSSEDYDEDLSEIYEYDLSYFFGKECSIYLDANQLELDKASAKSQKVKLGEEYQNEKLYTLYSNVYDISRGRQAFAQYPPQSVIDRSVVMIDFGERLHDINQMWINVRCPDLKDFNPALVWTVVALILAITVAIVLYRFRYKIFYRDKKKKDNS